MFQFEHIFLFPVELLVFNRRYLLEWVRGNLVSARLGQFDLGGGFHCWRWEAIEVIRLMLLHYRRRQRRHLLDLSFGFLGGANDIR